MIEIIPAIDLIDGQCVRLRQGSYTDKTTYSSDPVAVAKAFAGCGLRRLHLVDLDGARAGAPQNLGVLRRIAAATSLAVDFSGGVRCDADLDRVFAAGAAYVGIGSLALKDPGLLKSWVRRFGPQRFLLGADVRDGKLAVQGWTEQSDVALFPFLEAMTGLGIRSVFCTDIAQDGMLAGPALELYSGIINVFPELELTASGGVRNMQDIRALETIGCKGVIVGKAIYEGSISLGELSTKPAAV